MGRGVGTGETGEARASPEFRGFTTEKFLASWINEGGSFSCFTGKKLVPRPLNIFSEKSYFWYLLGQYHFKKSVSTYNILHEKSWPLFYSALVLCSYFYIIYIYENIPWKNKIFGTISDHRYLNHIYFWNLAILFPVLYLLPFTTKFIH